MKLFFIFFLIPCFCLSQEFSIVIQTTGDSAIKQAEKFSTGTSREYATERHSQEEAFSNAISMISIFKSAAVENEIVKSEFESSKDNTMETNTEFRSNSKLTSKIFFEVSEVRFYTEQYLYKDVNKTVYKSWCYVPFDDSIFTKFLQKLQINYTAKVLENEQQYSRATFPQKRIELLSSLYRVYHSDFTRFDSLFSTANIFTNYLKSKRDYYQQLISGFSDSITLKIISQSPNTLQFSFLFQNIPLAFPILAQEKNHAATLDTPLIPIASLTGNSYSIKAHARRSGKTILSLIPVLDIFDELHIEKHFDVPFTAELQTRFSNKNVGIVIINSANQTILNSAVAFCSNALNTIEAHVESMNEMEEKNALQNAAARGFDLLVFGKAHITQQPTYNQREEIYVAFPQLSLHVLDVQTRETVFQYEFPDENEFRYIQGFGKSANAAKEDALSFKSVFSNEKFVKLLSNF
jgi:hypothetical protein